MGSSDSIFARLANRFRYAPNPNTAGRDTGVNNSPAPDLVRISSPPTSNPKLESRINDGKPKNMSMNFSTILPILGQILSQTSQFIAGQAITIQVPAETAVLDLTAQGIGKVDISESGTTISIKKAV